MRQRLDHDVVVVGAGLSGLVAATVLTRAGARATVLEAQGEVGGRARSSTLAGEPVDLGGEFVGAHHARLRRLIADLDLHIRPALGFPRLTLDRSVRPSPASVASVAASAWELWRLCRRLPSGNPWTAGEAHGLDALSVEDWLRRRGVAADARRFLDAVVASLAGVSAAELSMLHWVWWILPAGGPWAAMRRNTRYRVAEGAQTVADRLAAQLGDRVCLDTEVARVSQDQQAVQLHTTAGDVYQAAHVAVAVPLAVTPRIAFEPELDPDQRTLTQAAPTASFSKIVAVVAPAKPKRATIALGGEHLVMAVRYGRRALGFAYGEHAHTPDDRLLAELAATLRLDDNEVVASLVRNWRTEPFAGGAYPAFAPGQLSQLGPHLRGSHGRVHFAGGDRSVCPGTLEGAVRDGERVAARLLGELHGGAS